MPIFTTTITGTDAWGREHKADVTWASETVKGVDHGMDNIGMSPVAWGSVDECPVYYGRPDSTGHCNLRLNMFTIDADTSYVARPVRVATRSEVRAGTFYVKERS